MPGIFELEGEVHHDQLENAFKQLVQRHEGLRTYFETVDGKLYKSSTFSAIPFRLQNGSRNRCY